MNYLLNREGVLFFSTVLVFYLLMLRLILDLRSSTFFYIGPASCTVK